MVPLVNIQLGEIIVGGVGSGLYGMLLFVILAIFVAGLMVGRTPEYLGKKIEAQGGQDGDARHPDPAADVSRLHRGRGGAAGRRWPRMANAGPHGFTEILYAYTSQTGNNGSAFAGLTANTLFYNITGAVAMFVGRFLMIVPMLAIAGSLAAKKIVPASAGTFPTTGGLFVGLLVGVILIVGGLTFFPALALGPIVEHLAMQRRHPVLSEFTRSRSQWKPSTLRKRMPVSALLDPKIVVPAIGAAFVKLDPRTLIKNPVMFVRRGRHRADHGHLHPRSRHRRRAISASTFQIILWLWFTVLFANFAEAVAEGRGKAQADTLRRQRTETQAKLLDRRRPARTIELVPAHRA